ncbi:hypothetical protein HNR05_001431 [Leifsonia psychrotolerans]|uniref:Uncharacterized protein n=1 Tax=Glaciibacter psychrotolerans TaxID=670054 RepID=A0A7Z0J5P8_9MICO|nr:hypothetical protein [Leifsonia psychrotolerans]
MLFACVAFAGVLFACVAFAGVLFACVAFAGVLFAGVLFACVALAGVLFAAVDLAGAPFAGACVAAAVITVELCPTAGLAGAGAGAGVDLVPGMSFTGWSGSGGVGTEVTSQTYQASARCVARDARHCADEHRRFSWENPPCSITNWIRLHEFFTVVRVRGYCGSGITVCLNVNFWANREQILQH